MLGRAGRAGHAGVQARVLVALDDLADGHGVEPGRASARLAEGHGVRVVLQLELELGDGARRAGEPGRDAARLGQEAPWRRGGGGSQARCS